MSRSTLIALLILALAIVGLVAQGDPCERANDPAACAVVLPGR